MSERKFYALGTASQVPTRKRNHNGYFLRWDEHGFLFDPGEGTQRQMIYAGLAAQDITKIFITHFHGDHCLGLPGILQRLSLDRVPHPVQVYFPASGEKYFENLKDASIYYNTARIEPVPIRLEGVLYRDETITISSAPLDHSVESWGFRMQEPDSYRLDKAKIASLGLRGPMVGRLKAEGRITVDGRTIYVAEAGALKKGLGFAFIMDTRYCAAAQRLAHAADVLVAESTFLQMHQAEATAHGHMTAADAARLAQNAGARLLVLTHFSQRYSDDADFAGEAKSIHAHTVAVVDGDTIDLRERRAD